MWINREFSRSFEVTFHKLLKRDSRFSNLLVMFIILLLRFFLASSSYYIYHSLYLFSFSLVGFASCISFYCYTRISGFIKELEMQAAEKPQSQIKHPCKSAPDQRESICLEEVKKNTNDCEYFSLTGLNV